MPKLWTVKDDAYGHSIESANGDWISITSAFGAAWLAVELNRLHQVELKLKELEKERRK